MERLATNDIELLPSDSNDRADDSPDPSSSNGVSEAPLDKVERRAVSRSRLAAWWRKNTFGAASEIEWARRWGCSLATLRQLLHGESKISFATACKISSDTKIPLERLRAEILAIDKDQLEQIPMKGLLELEAEARRAASKEFEHTQKERETVANWISINGPYNDSLVQKGWLGLKSAEDVWFPGAAGVLREIHTGLQVSVVINTRVLVRPVYGYTKDFLCEGYFNESKELVIKTVSLRAISSICLKPGTVFAEATFFKQQQLQFNFQGKNTSSVGGSW